MGIKLDFEDTAAVFFDLDGTLVDTAPDFVQIINRMRRARALVELPYDAIRSQVSNGASGLVTSCLNMDPKGAEFSKVVEELLLRYSECIGDLAKIFKGGERVLQSLDDQGIPWGVVTNKPERFTTALLNRLLYLGKPIVESISVTICPDHVVERKPHPESLFLAASRLSVPSSRCVYVGDHARDIQAGNAANMKTIGVRNGYVSANDDPETWQADYLITNFCDIQQLLFDS